MNDRERVAHGAALSSRPLGLPSSRWKGRAEDHFPDRRKGVPARLRRGRLVCGGPFSVLPRQGPRPCPSRTGAVRAGAAVAAKWPREGPFQSVS
ncbi:hypothetical protein ATO2_14410 [Roseovarius sp. 22II1-1F6A]|nr:hypothetical protein ATO2_14410 [Roseovarius sp. 22II1-1F6A]